MKQESYSDQHFTHLRAVRIGWNNKAFNLIGSSISDEVLEGVWDRVFPYLNTISNQVRSTLTNDRRR